ncbi:hypothetical protein A3194_12815 [Candidatus Thiodiazotropha endoloripes]|uniref:hypothetical protein n=1 Tax=Candidatus Thiodiazotropha endoloripes TaxID=1818881 RepID=UPI00083E0EAD|nr:hypothetical protein [Candidatus Thiodiazotropha endoloripes]MCG7984642.1 hypothetical protein [Candidatus Thiodiazotropha lotti]ODB85707.1 hypothetical protein A3194_12815 [Candidatus Thiodiazotropha endoloripes]
MFEHKYIVFLDNVLEQKGGSFRLDPALKASGLSKDEFEQIRDAYFYRDNLPERIDSASQSLEWRLKPEAVFWYLNYKQYAHAIKSTKKAFWISAASLAVATIGIVIAMVLR